MLYENLREILKSVLIVRELQPSTINTYMVIYDSFARYCDYLKKKAEDVTREEILFYLSKIKSEETRRQAKGVLTNLYEFVLMQGFKMMGIPNPKKHYEVPDYFSLYELDLIFNSVSNVKQRTLLKLEYGCALRVSEACNVKKADFLKRFDGTKYFFELKVKGKGGNTDLVPVPDETMQQILYYLSIQKGKELASEYLFAGQFRSAYSSKTVQVILNRAMRKLNIVKYGNHNTHFLRITRGTQLLLAGVDISMVQKLLRHKSIKTTNQYYNGIKTTDLRVIFSKADHLLETRLNAEKKLRLTA